MTSDTLTTLLSRRSCPKLSEPAPSADELALMLQAASCAPDHANLKPWDFIVVQGDARVEMGELWQRCAKATNPDIAEATYERAKQLPLRAPLLIIGCARIKSHPKVPAVEQLLSTGAALTNVLNAAHALGYGAIWRTGAMAYDPGFKAALGLAEADAIVGVLYIGTPEAAVKGLERPVAGDFVRDWSAG